MTKIRGFELVSSYTNQGLTAKTGKRPTRLVNDLKVARAHGDCSRGNRPRANWGQGLYASG